MTSINPHSARTRMFNGRRIYNGRELTASVLCRPYSGEAIGISCPFDSVCLIYTLEWSSSWERPINEEMVVLFTRLTFYNFRVRRWFINTTEQKYKTRNQINRTVSSPGSPSFIFFFSLNGAGKYNQKLFSRLSRTLKNT